jgi:hypothetical protein
MIVCLFTVVSSYVMNVMIVALFRVAIIYVI